MACPKKKTHFLDQCLSSKYTTKKENCDEVELTQEPKTQWRRWCCLKKPSHQTKKQVSLYCQAKEYEKKKEKRKRERN